MDGEMPHTRSHVVLEGSSRESRQSTMDSEHSNYLKPIAWNIGGWTSLPHNSARVVVAQARRKSSGSVFEGSKDPMKCRFKHA